MSSVKGMVYASLLIMVPWIMQAIFAALALFLPVQKLLAENVNDVGMHSYMAIDGQRVRGEGT